MGDLRLFDDKQTIENCKGLLALTTQLPEEIYWAEGRTAFGSTTLLQYLSIFLLSLKNSAKIQSLCKFNGRTAFLGLQYFTVTFPQVCNSSEFNKAYWLLSLLISIPGHSVSYLATISDNPELLLNLWWGGTAILCTLNTSNSPW